MAEEAPAAVAAEGAKACITGATGAVGRYVVKTLTEDDRFASVVAFVRSERDAEFFLIEDDAAAAKLVQVVVPDMADIAEHAESFEGVTHAYFCLGIYSADADEETFRAKEIGYNTGAGQLAFDAGARRAAYLSGQGAKSGGWAKFARVKGDCEKALRDIGFDNMAACRPPFIADRPGKPVYGVMETFVNKHMRWVQKTSLAVSAQNVARAMVAATLTDSPVDVYEAADLQTMADGYVAEQMAVSDEDKAAMLEGAAEGKKKKSSHGICKGHSKKKEEEAKPDFDPSEFEEAGIDEETGEGEEE